MKITIDLFMILKVYLVGCIIELFLLKLGEIINKFKRPIKETFISCVFSWVAVFYLLWDIYIMLLDKVLTKVKIKNPITFVFLSTILHGQFTRKSFIKNMFSYRYYCRKRQGAMYKFFHGDVYWDRYDNSWEYYVYFLKSYYVERYGKRGWLNEFVNYIYTFCNSLFSKEI